MSFAAMFLALVASTTAMPAVSPAAIAPRAANSSGAYELVADYCGNTFFDQFAAYTGPDPTNGHVVYQSLADAADQKLVGFIYNATSSDSTAYIGPDSTNVAPNGRNSVRLTSKQTFEAGSMAVIDVRHAPSQYGVWPAIWLLGSEGTWPASGESDILEYVHEDSYNGMTLHTSPGCSVNNASLAQQQGRLLNTNCNTGNAATGCSVAAYDQSRLAGTSSKVFSTAGHRFNLQSGGVYVHDWQADGITVWMFAQDHLPADLVAGKPNPSTWKQKPLAKFSGDCDFSSAFKSMQMIINIDFCGDWAGKVWESSGAANATGVATCNDYVANNPKVFEEAYFEIASIKFYTNNAQKPGAGPTFSKRDEALVQFPNITRPGCNHGHNMTTSSAFNTSSSHSHSHNVSRPTPYLNATATHSHNCSGHHNATATSQPYTATLDARTVSQILESGSTSPFAIGWYIAAGTFLVFAFIL
ncbi:putative endo-1,3(4)-beta-glucanase [Pseudocercospora fuligena]|uniref:Putative endo-1,3(4)-beta-glucanase n=1 Tax=Pseudocercospora fuligena TaxID=685502 RepID=A0A8H6RJ64_9PEZI|nr:putative endo-1,3(4)-beta-glucanase [Pseudocercospora fuligena]